MPLLLGGDSDQATFGLDVIFPADVGRELITNTVDITDDGANSIVPSTDTDSDNTPLIAAPDLFVTKTPNVTQTDRGQVIIYTLLYGNNGNQNASSSLVREIVPQGSVYNEADSTPTVWSCGDGSPGGTDCEFATGALDALDGGTLTFAVTVTDIPSDRIILNEVAIDLDAAGVDGLDPNLGDNLAFARTPFPALSINTVTRPVLALSILMLLFAGMQQARRAARKQ